jgi:hypothetical protein
MAPPADDHGHHVKRVVLPSGKTIEVVYFDEQEFEHAPGMPVVAPDTDLHVCVCCGSALAYPTDWEEAGRESWSVTIRCPECEEVREGVFAQHVVEAFDVRLDEGTEALTSDYRRLMRSNMAEEMELFVAALEAGAIVPEDF